MALMLTGTNPYLQFQWQLEAIPYDRSVFSETILFENETFNFDCELRYGTQLSVSAIKRPFGFWTTDITDIVCTVDKGLCCDMNRDEHINTLWTFCFDVSVERSCTLSFRVHLCENVRQYQHQLIDCFLSDQLWQAAEKKLITDIDFNIDGKIIAAHRSILTARCPTLLMCSTGVEDANVETFSALLRFIYTGKLITKPNAQLSKLAEKFGLSTLQSLCSMQSDSDVQVANSTHRFSFTYRRKSGAVVRSLTGLTVKCVISFPTFSSVTTYQPQCFMFHGQPLFNFTLNYDLHKCSVVITSCVCSDWRINEIFFRCKNSRPTIFHQKHPEEFQAEFCKHQKFSKQEYLTVSIDAYVVPNVDRFEFQPIDIHLPSDLWLLVQKRILADFELVIQGNNDHSFLAHRAILAARSTHFSNMFNSGMVESQSGKVVITDTDVGVFEQFLHFLYTGNVEPFTDFQALLVIADRYQIDSLINLCETKVACII